MDFRVRMDLITSKVCQINQLYDLCAKEAGLTFNAFQIYFSLDLHAPCTQKDIVNKWGIPKQSVNFIIKNLEQQGFVEFTQGRNKKEKLIVLTEAGKEEITNRLALCREIEDKILSRIGNKDLEHFYKTQEKFIYNFTKELTRRNLLPKQ